MGKGEKADACSYANNSELVSLNTAQESRPTAGNTRLEHGGCKPSIPVTRRRDEADNSAASCSRAQTRPSQLRVDCVTFQSVVTACIVVGGGGVGECTSWGALRLCLCESAYMCLNGTGIEGIRNAGASGHTMICMRLRWRQ